MALKNSSITGVLFKSIYYPERETTAYGSRITITPAGFRRLVDAYFKNSTIEEIS